MESSSFQTDAENSTLISLENSQESKKTIGKTFIRQNRTAGINGLFAVFLFIHMNHYKADAWNSLCWNDWCQCWMPSADQPTTFGNAVAWTSSLCVFYCFVLVSHWRSKSWTFALSQNRSVHRAQLTRVQSESWSQWSLQERPFEIAGPETHEEPFEVPRTNHFMPYGIWKRIQKLLIWLTKIAAVGCKFPSATRYF